MSLELDPCYTPSLVQMIWWNPSTNFHSSHNLPLSAYEIISWLRDEGLPISIIAEMMGVERKSVYSWINKGEIRHQNQERLEKLYRLLSENKPSSLYQLYRFWNRQLKIGTSLGCLLREKQLDTTLIKQALRELWPIAKKYEYLSLNRPKEESKNPFLQDITEVSITNEP
jgi:DNA-binding transcriptional MerR regulator